MKLKTRNLSMSALLLVVCLTLLAACGEDDANNNNNDTTNENNVTAGFTVEIDAAASALTVNEGESVEVAFIVDNTGEEDATATVEFSLNDTTDSMEVEVEGSASASGSFTWDTAEGDAGDYTAEVSIDDVTDTAEVTVNEAEEVGEAVFELAIDEENSTLEVEEGEVLSIMIVATNTGTAEGIVELSGQVEVEGGGTVALTLEQQGEDANTPIPPSQGIQIEAQLPTGPGDQELSAGTHTLTINTPDDSASVQLVITAPAG